MITKIKDISKELLSRTSRTSFQSEGDGGIWVVLKKEIDYVDLCIVCGERVTFISSQQCYTPASFIPVSYPCLVYLYLERYDYDGSDALIGVCLSLLDAKEFVGSVDDIL